ncbi:MAG: lysozyme inhibitor LprI family protein [Spirochaetota bacterium]
MKFIIIFLTLFIPLLAQSKHPIEKWTEEQLAKPENATTLAMMRITHQATRKWDLELNRTYKKLKKVLKPSTYQKLRKSQIAWIRFKEKEIAFLTEFYNRSGTIYPLMRDSAILEITKNRVIELQSTLELFNGM